MVKMGKCSEAFLKAHLPRALQCTTVNGVLDLLYDFIEENGFAPPHYEDYNDLGREAQKVYDDIYLSNLDETIK